jgi:hypothetical protein
MMNEHAEIKRLRKLLHLSRREFDVFVARMVTDPQAAIVALAAWNGWSAETDSRAGLRLSIIERHRPLCRSEAVR